MEEREKFLQAILADDAKTFGEMPKECYAWRFGRFPVMSLCLLFGSKHILAHFGDELLQIKQTEDVGASLDADNTFRDKAGKALRLYLNRPVSPIVMMAILGQFKMIGRIYRAGQLNEAMQKSVQTAVALKHDRQITFDNGKMHVSPRKFTFAERRLAKQSFIYSFIAATLVAILTIIVAVCGGVKKSQYTIKQGGALISIAEGSSANIEINKDISLSGTIKNSAAKINGNNNEILLSKPFAKKFTGELKDVTFVVLEDFRGSAIIEENVGKIDNVKVVCKANSLERVAEYQGLLAAKNSGTINGCVVEGQIEILGDGVNCSFGLICGENSGEITNCDIKTDLTTTMIDIAGVASANTATGKISDVTFDGALSQSAISEAWNPYAAGICLVNYGTIERCTATGSVSVNFTNTNTDKTPESFAAGICCMNNGLVSVCHAANTVECIAIGGVAIAGGVVSMNAYVVDETNTKVTSIGQVITSESVSNVKASSDTHTAYVGGVVGYNRGYVKNCYATGKLSLAANGDEYGHIGGIVGCQLNVLSLSKALEIGYFIGEIEAEGKTLVGAIAGSTKVTTQLFYYYTDIQNTVFFIDGWTGRAVGGVWGLDATGRYYVILDEAVVSSTYPQMYYLGTSGQPDLDAVKRWEGYRE